MSKIIRKAVILVVVISMIVGMSSGAFASATANRSTSMEAALLAVRRLINIDDDVYTEFEFHSFYSNFETREGLVWSFQWGDGENRVIFATVNEDGTVMGFDRFIWGDTPRFGFAQISRAQALAIGDEFIRNANPESYTFFINRSNVTVNINERDFHLTYTAEVNGHQFSAAQISIRVNKFTGEIMGFSNSFICPTRFNFSAADDIISESAAIAAHAEKIGLSLEYRTFFNFAERTVAVLPVYTFNAPGMSFISASTGEVVQFVFDRGNQVEFARQEDDEFALGLVPDAPAARAAGLSPVEIAAVERVGNLLTGQQALANLLEVAGVEDLDVDEFTQSIRLTRDFFNEERYIYEIFMSRRGFEELARGEVPIESLSGMVDASTGRVLSFWSSYDFRAMAEFGEVQYTFAEAEEIAKNFLRAQAPTEFAGSRSETEEAPGIMPFLHSFGMNYNFSYTRFENDIPVRNNGLNVTVSPFTGRVTAYSLNWFENVEFRSVSNVLSVAEALAAFVRQNGTELYYITIGDSNAELVYGINNMSFVDPFTGKAIDFMGEPWVDTAIVPLFDDVIGHWSEEIVLKLLENGIYPWNGPFEPDRNMTQQEFLDLLMLLRPQSFHHFSHVVFSGVDALNIDIQPNRILTRQEAARIVVEFLGYGNIAEHYEWFVFPFNDNVNDEFKGFITIAYMLGIVSGTGNGNFGANSNITRAQAAVMLHNLILAME